MEEVDTGLHWPQPGGFPFVTALCADLPLLELSLENFSPKTFQCHVGPETNLKGEY